MVLFDDDENVLESGKRLGKPWNGEDYLEQKEPPKASHTFDPD
jgi:hypothetical protein